MLRTLESNSNVPKSNQSSSNPNDLNDTDESSSRQDTMKQHGKVSNVVIMDENRDLQCMDIMLQQSSLANELRLIFHGLIGGQSLSLTVNNVLHLNMNLKDIDNEDIDNIKPYHTLLLIDESKVIFTLISNMNTSPTDDSMSSISRISSQLQKIIKAADPTKSFLDLSILLEEPLSELYALARHLQQWGLAKIITTITASNRYRVHINAPIEVDSKVAKSFSAIFSNVKRQVNPSKSSSPDIVLSNNDKLSIARILACFNGMRTVSEAIEYFPTSYSSYAIDIIVWLLRWRMLCEVHTCLIRTNLNDPVSTIIDTNNTTPTKSTPKTQFHNIEVKEDLTIDEEAVFDKLKGYLTGNTTLLEILWKEGISEETIKSIVSKRQEEIEIIDFSDFND
jgi:hypothetical protein